MSSYPFPLFASSCSLPYSQSFILESPQHTNTPQGTRGCVNVYFAFFFLFFRERKPEKENEDNGNAISAVIPVKVASFARSVSSKHRE
jgi:hypothetical protein